LVLCQRRARLDQKMAATSSVSVLALTQLIDATSAPLPPRPAADAAERRWSCALEVGAIDASLTIRPLRLTREQRRQVPAPPRMFPAEHDLCGGNVFYVRADTLIDGEQAKRLLSAAELTHISRIDHDLQ
jgi:hypothetical protein